MADAAAAGAAGEGGTGGDPEAVPPPFRAITP